MGAGGLRAEDNCNASNYAVNYMSPLNAGVDNGAATLLYGGNNDVCTTNPIATAITPATTINTTGSGGMVITSSITTPICNSSNVHAISRGNSILGTTTAPTATALLIHNKGNSLNGANGHANSNTSTSTMSVEFCLVCGDRASGRHYGAISCEGCKGFFKRSIRKQLGYQCRGTMNCEVTKHHRNRCQFCRLQKCLASGMRSDSVQHERKPIVDKKENNFANLSSSIAGSLVAATGSSIGGRSSSLKSTPSPVSYQQQQQQSQQPSRHNNKSSASSSSSSTNIFNNNLHAAAVAAANVAAAFSIDNNLSAAATSAALSLDNNLAAAAAAAGIFPMGLNFAELTQTLMLASQQQQQQNQIHQQQQQQQQSAPTIMSARSTSSVNKSTPFNFTANAKDLNDNDEIGEDSFDNSTSLCLQSLSTAAVASMNNNNSQYVNYNMENLNNSTNSNSQHPIANQAAISIIQTWLDNRAIGKALQMMQTIQQQLEQITMTGGNSFFIKSENREEANLGGGGEDIGGESSMNGDNDEAMGGQDRSSSQSINNTGGVIDDQSNSTLEDQNDDITMDYGEVFNEERDFTINETIFLTDLLSHESANFNLQTPTLVSSYFNAHYVCETGSRIMFLTAFWLRKVNAFCELPQQCQVILLRQSWPALIAIAIAQVDSLSQATIIKTLISNTRQLTESIDKIIDPQKIIKLSEHIARISSFIQYIHTLNPSNMEYAYLRLVCVFNPHVFLKRKDQHIRVYVQRVQQYALASLRKFLLTARVATSTPTTTATGAISSDADERFNALILNIMPLSALDSETIEELFFVKLLGHVQIDNVLPYIIALNANMTNLQ